IVRRFGLKNPIFSPTAAYGHVGRKPYRAKVKIQGEEKEVQFFGWELLDRVDELKRAFGL
ncbi:MAG: methionine adenosyltransferase, partial [Bacteroidales bacterium]|nr:methionine adenosyltransferase [Bacteroidales bacterium]